MIEVNATETRGAEMTSHSKSPHAPREGLSRRHLIHVAAAGAATASIATSSLAQTTAVLAEASAADYARDPTRWGSAEIAALFPGFKHLDMRTKGADHSRAPWRFGTAIAVASWLSEQSRALARGRGKAGAALSRGVSRSQGLWRFLAARARRQAHQLQPSRDGRRHDRSDGATRPSAILPDRP